MSAMIGQYDNYENYHKWESNFIVTEKYQGPSY